jgi:hypothetical protein
MPKRDITGYRRISDYEHTNMYYSGLKFKLFTGLFVLFVFVLVLAAMR